MLVHRISGASCAGAGRSTRRWVRVLGRPSTGAVAIVVAVAAMQQVAVPHVGMPCTTPWRAVVTVPLPLARTASRPTVLPTNTHDIACPWCSLRAAGAGLPSGGAGPLVTAPGRFPFFGDSTARPPVERFGRAPRERRRAEVPPAGASAACAGSGARSAPE